MTTAPQASRPWPRLAAAALLVGLVVFSMSLLLMALVTAESDAAPLRQAEALQVNGTAALTYGLPSSYERQGVLVGTYAFPTGPGDVLLLSCGDYDRFRTGEAPLAPVVVARSQTEGHVSLAASAWPTHDVWFGTGGPPPPWGWPGPLGTPSPVWCDRVFLVLPWQGNVSDPQQWPQTDLAVEHNPLDEPVAVVVVGISAAGAALAIGGGFALTRARARLTPDDDPPEGAAEVLLRLAEGTTSWLERARRYLILSGVLGIFLWYPVLIPFAWSVGRHGSDAEWMPWLLASIALLLLAGMTFLWAREFVRLDRELERWRARVERIRTRKEDLLASLERDA